MKVWLVSRFPPHKCGVAEYSKNLLDGLAQVHGVEVTAVPVERFSDALRVALRRKPPTLDVIHLQHEFLLYGKPYKSILYFFTMLLALRVTKCHTVLTIHSLLRRPEAVHAFRNYGFPHAIMLQYTLGRWIHFFLLRLVSCIIVHSDYHACGLCADFGVQRWKVRVIPHGV